MRHGGDFIGALCVALEHRWKAEELFVLFTAYFDEADTHGPSPNMVMSCFLGNARQWEIFSRRLRNLQKEKKFSIYHAKELRARTGEFKGWSDDDRNSLIHDLVTISKDELTASVVTYLDHSRYINEFRNGFPKGVLPDSQYGVCFRFIVRHLANLLFATKQRQKLHVVVERGHRNATNTEVIFNEYKETLKARGVDLFGTWTVARKEEAPPLMVADLMAGFYAIMRRPGGIGLAGYANATPEPGKGEAGLVFLEPEANALSELRLDIQRQHAERRAHKRKDRAEAKKLASSLRSAGGQPS